MRADIVWIVSRGDRLFHAFRRADVEGSGLAQTLCERYPLLDGPPQDDNDLPGTQGVDCEACCKRLARAFYVPLNQEPSR